MSVSTAFVIIWCAFTFATVLVVTPVLVWAIRNKQFTRDDRVRYLALECSLPVVDGPSKEAPPCCD